MLYKYLELIIITEKLCSAVIHANYLSLLIKAISASAA